MLSRLLRQRRRIIILALAAALACALRFGPGLSSVVGMGLGIGLATVIVLAMPLQRRIIECMALSLPLVALMPVHNVATPIAMGALMMIFHILLYGCWSDKTPLRLGLISRRCSSVQALPQTIWQAMVPGEGTAEQHWTGTMIDFMHDPTNPMVVCCRTASDTGIPDEALVTFKERVPFERCTFTLNRATEDLGPNALDEAVYKIKITEGAPRRCTIESEMRYAALPLRLALSRWFDDEMGDEWDSFAATLACKRDWSMRAADTRQIANSIVR